MLLLLPAQQPAKGAGCKSLQNGGRLLQRIANALLTRFAPDLREQIREIVAEEREHDKKLVRELVGEMDDVLEKFNRVVAREAMRRSREMKKTLEDQPAATAENSGVPLDGKDAIRRRLALMGGQRGLPRPSTEPIE